MSRIDDLIREYCPDGVEFIELQDLFDTRNGYTPSRSNPEFWENGTIPWFRLADIRENGKILEDSLEKISEPAVKKSGLFPADTLIISTLATIGEHALLKVPSLCNQQLTALMLKKEHQQSFNIKFLFYYCFVLAEWCKNSVMESSFPSVDMRRFKHFKFPVPPLEVQDEIVRILDSFTQLEAELEARRKQYEYYRDSLLSFENLEARLGGGIRLMPLGKVGTFTRGTGLQKKDFTESGVGCIHYGQIYTKYGTFTSFTHSFTSGKIAVKLKHASIGDLLIATTSENDEDLAKAVAWLGDDEIVYSGDMCSFTHSLNPKYVSYFFGTSYFQVQKQKFITGTKVRRIAPTGLAKIGIPVPPLSEQERIVSILDNFDALTTDLSSGLPAEIQARRKQYEYYRDKLLTFEEAK